MTTSPFDEPGAVAPVDADAATTTAATNADAAVPAHYGDPFGEQRAMTRRAGVVDRSHRGVLRVTGPERLSWLHLLLSQQVADLPDGGGTEALVLDAQGRVEHHAVLAHVDDTVWLDVEPGRAAALADYLDRMRFWSQVEVADETEAWALLSVVGPAVDEVLTSAGVPAPHGDHAAAALPGGGVVRRMPWPGPDAEAAVDVVVPRAEVGSWWSRLRGAGARAAGHDAYEALRVAALRPRLGTDTDERAIPHEMGWIGAAVHLHKGCYRGQETVSRVANLGRPPRQLVLLHLQSGDDPLPPPGTPVLGEEGGRAVGRLGSVVRHHELGTVALALLKRSAVTSAPGGAPLWVAPESEDLVAGPAAVDPDSIPPDTGEPPGRAAMRRLRG
ncbi:YgfZ/GcvT domain-containing protein [Actinomycetospora straminea]|uniref:Folate-binding protein YgfZ n=1 Tax=Actinomycetospora straminea TaxID=663607 RepID=A0ABP9F775_9PSEU